MTRGGLGFADSLTPLQPERPRAGQRLLLLPRRLRQRRRVRFLTQGKGLLSTPRRGKSSWPRRRRKDPPRRDVALAHRRRLPAVPGAHLRQPPAPAPEGRPEGAAPVSAPFRYVSVREPGSRGYVWTSLLTRCISRRESYTLSVATKRVSSSAITPRTSGQPAPLMATPTALAIPGTVVSTSM